MARVRLDGGVNVNVDYTKINDNYDLDDALQTATGLTEGATNIGSFTLPSARAAQSTDSLRSLALVLEARSSVAGTKFDPTSTTRTARALGDDYDYQAADEGFEGTTNITTTGQATTLDYPAGSGIYTISTIRSAAAGAQAAGYNRIVIACKTTTAYIRIYWNGTWLPWRQLGAAGGQTYVVQFADTDWSGPSGGNYTLTISASDHGFSRLVEVTNIYEIVGGSSLEPVVVDYAINGSTGDVVLTVSETPDNRFDGRVYLRSHINETTFS